ncbi:MAG TPA: sugar phosphate isomerase/epimerase, partial [Candidatus Latescibacteria bacterium]|nr:sugar phosphate isomerase/epimerase [Candidatus Latescibacterota bacterium]
HHTELIHVGDRIGLNILIEDSDPALGFEIDTYWIQYGGGDPTVWITKVKDRCPIIHFKDLAVVGREQVMAEIGEGNMNWPGIVAACE